MNPPKPRPLGRISTATFFKKAIGLKFTLSSIDDTACKYDLLHPNEEQATALSPVPSSSNPLPDEIAEDSPSSPSLSSHLSKLVPLTLLSSKFIVMQA